ncbi:MAG: YggT family protein [Chloroflexota bacterium]
MYILIQMVHFVSRAFILLVIVDAVMSFFVDSYHPVRVAIRRIVDPLLNPIRRTLPTVGMIDFSPLVLIIILQVVETLLVRVLASMA